MADYIFLMHGLPESLKSVETDWAPYLKRLEAGGHLRGGSAIGHGACFNRNGAAFGITAHLTGFVRVEADSLEAASTLLPGNPVYEAGGTVEIRELPKTE